MSIDGWVIATIKLTFYIDSFAIALNVIFIFIWDKLVITFLIRIEIIVIIISTDTVIKIDNNIKIYRYRIKLDSLR